MAVVFNCTPHDIVVVKGNQKIVFPKGEIIVRIATKEVETTPVKTFHPEYGVVEIPTVKQTFEEVKVFKNGKPMAKEEIEKEFKNVDVIIVPLVVGQWAEKVREVIGKDIRIVAPNTAKAIRNENGQIVGVPNFIEF